MYLQSCTLQYVWLLHCLVFEQPHLNGKHVVFGRVVNGTEVLQAIEKAGDLRGSFRRTLSFLFLCDSPVTVLSFARRE